MPDGVVELRQISDVDEGSTIDQFLEERVVIGSASPLPQHARQRFAIATLDDSVPRLVFKDPQRPESGSAKLMRLLQDHLEDWGKVAGRGIDDLQDLGGGGLLFQGLSGLGGQ